MTLPPESLPPDRLADLRTSARGWHGVQLAVIGFIGLCGVLQGGRPEHPMWLQVFAGVAALAALALACVATFLVARVAWPLYGAGTAPAADEAAQLRRDGRRIRLGLVLTFAAVALLALGTASGWWPADEDTGSGSASGGGGLVALQATSGERACGRLAEAEPGSLALTVDGRRVVVALQSVASLRPVDGC